MAPRSTLRSRVALLSVIAAGGAIGAAARYGTALAIPPRSGMFPVATFGVNIVGAVILGAVAALPAGWLPAHDLSRAGIGTGFCGGLTTFSTMSLEIYERVHPTPGVAVGYAAASVIAAPACAWAGFAIASARLASRARAAPPVPSEEKKT